MNSDKIKSVIEWSTPINVKEIQSFLEFTNFYWKFIKDYSKLVTPLTDLTRKNKIFIWIKKAEEFFQLLKKRFTSQSILTTFDSEKQIMLKTDASDRALKACLSQSDEIKWLHSVMFYSWKFFSAELNYKIHNKKLLAIVNVFKQWRVYLKGLKHEVQIYSDHKNLLYFMFTKVLIRRQVC